SREGGREGERKEEGREEKEGKGGKKGRQGGRRETKEGRREGGRKEGERERDEGGMKEERRESQRDKGREGRKKKEGGKKKGWEGGQRQRKEGRKEGGRKEEKKEREGRMNKERREGWRGKGREGGREEGHGNSHQLSSTAEKLLSVSSFPGTVPMWVARCTNETIAAIHLKTEAKGCKRRHNRLVATFLRIWKCRKKRPFPGVENLPPQFQWNYVEIPGKLQPLLFSSTQRCPFPFFSHVFISQSRIFHLKNVDRIQKRQQQSPNFLLLSETVAFSWVVGLSSGVTSDYDFCNISTAIKKSRPMDILSSIVVVSRGLLVILTEENSRNTV
ncbi:Octapeptide-repeat protein T2, partial [Ophiophagus hannah]